MIGISGLLIIIYLNSVTVYNDITVTVYNDADF